MRLKMRDDESENEIIMKIFEKNNSILCKFLIVKRNYVFYYNGDIILMC